MEQIIIKKNPGSNTYQKAKKRLSQVINITHMQSCVEIGVDSDHPEEQAVGV